MRTVSLLFWCFDTSTIGEEGDVLPMSTSLDEIAPSSFGSLTGKSRPAFFEESSNSFPEVRRPARLDLTVGLQV